MIEQKIIITKDPDNIIFIDSRTDRLHLPVEYQQNCYRVHFADVRYAKQLEEFFDKLSSDAKNPVYCSIYRSDHTRYIHVKPDISVYRTAVIFLSDEDVVWFKMLHTTEKKTIRDTVHHMQLQLERDERI